MPELGCASLTSSQNCVCGTKTVEKHLGFPQIFFLYFAVWSWAEGTSIGPSDIPALCVQVGAVPGGGGEQFVFRGHTGPSGISSLRFSIISCNEAENRINNSSKTI